MGQRSVFFPIVTRVSLLFAALFLVGVLLAAIPAHNQPSAQSAPQQADSQRQAVANSSLSR